MNIKRIFGALLTILGITGLIYPAVLIAIQNSGTNNIIVQIIYGLLGIVFLLQGLAWYAP
jgi:uncharacterized membrane protein